jgi:hypothetical protein
LLARQFELADEPAGDRGLFLKANSALVLH